MHPKPQHVPRPWQMGLRQMPAPSRSLTLKLESNSPRPLQSNPKNRRIGVNVRRTLPITKPQARWCNGSGMRMLHATQSCCVPLPASRRCLLLCALPVPVPSQQAAHSGMCAGAQDTGGHDHRVLGEVDLGQHCGQGAALHANLEVGRWGDWAVEMHELCLVHAHMCGSCTHACEGAGILALYYTRVHLLQQLHGPSPSRCTLPLPASVPASRLHIQPLQSTPFKSCSCQRTSTTRHSFLPPHSPPPPSTQAIRHSKSPGPLRSSQPLNFRHPPRWSWSCRSAR